MIHSFTDGSDLLVGKLQAWREQIRSALEGHIAGAGLPREVRQALRSATTIPLSSRWRPMLVLQVGEILDCEASPLLLGACAVESLHCASLVLDDLPCMDNAERRRGQRALHRQFPESVAILAAIWLIGMSRTLLVRATQDAGTDPVAGASILRLAEEQQLLENELQEGQYLDLVCRAGRREDASLSPEAIARLKTGKLFAFSSRLPAFLTGGPDETERRASALHQFGENLGIAYQVMDDLDEAHGEMPGLQDASGGEQGQANFVTVYGVAGSRQKAQEYLGAALRALRPLREKGLVVQPLRAFAGQVLRRDFLDPLGETLDGE